MKNSFSILVLLLFLVSCNRQQEADKSLTADNSYSEVVATNTLDNTKETSKSEPTEGIISKESIQKLIDFNAIPGNYNTQLLFSESKYSPNDSVEVLLLKSFVDSANLLKCSDPIINFIMIRKGNKTTFVLPVSSASESDVTYEGFFNYSAAFTCYSSPVGYSKTLLIDLGNQVFITGALDEQQSADFKSFNTITGTYITLPDKTLQRDLKLLPISSGDIVSY